MLPYILSFMVQRFRNMIILKKPSHLRFYTTDAITALVLFFSTWLVFQSFGQQLVLPGTNPDPSVVKIGDTYWASATSSNWLPAFPLLYSTDLINWKQKGYIF